MKRSSLITRWLTVVLLFCLALPQSQGLATVQAKGQGAAACSDELPCMGANPARVLGGLDNDAPDERAEWFYAWRKAGSPAAGFSLPQAAELRAQAAAEVLAQKSAAQRLSTQGAASFGGAWSPLGPNPIVQVARSNNAFYAVSGRVTALAVRSTAPHDIFLGSAQGGVWKLAEGGSSWTPLTDNLGSLAIGAIALAPSNENIIYVGTGEGNLSLDSYFGNGVLKSTDGGVSFAHVGGSAFNQVSFSKIAVDPTNPDHLYAAVLRGREGDPSLPGPNPTASGVYESTDGGNNWTPRKTATNGTTEATDLVIDPANPAVVYASFLGQGIFKSSNSGLSWTSLMGNGFPAGANYAAAPSRFSLGISRPNGAGNATLYTGFEYFTSNLVHIPAGVWKSTDDGASWAQVNNSTISDYCSSQCWYDNIIGVDPNNPNLVYVLGMFNYNTGTGGVFRSMDGGASWVDLGWMQHPDFHAIAIRSDVAGSVVIGSDGGAWASSNYGGRTSPGSLASDVDWVDLNGTVDPNTAAVTVRSGLQITQFNGLRQNPTQPGRIYAGAQDNGTSRRSLTNATWLDVASGDGGQALVDPYSANYVYGTYFRLSPYRFSDAGVAFFGNTNILSGISTSDRSAFYVPFEMDPWNTQRLYIGSYRLYRTDNRGDQWAAISGDLTTGCSSSAGSPTGFACVITAIGVTAGGPYVYVGTGDGQISLSSNAFDASPSWTNLTKAPLPARPISHVSVDSSNYKLAYLTYGGFNAATPGQPGHVFRTTDGGQSWTDISGNLPDIPVNTLTIDPQNGNTLYAGTDVGPMVSTNGGTSWLPLGTGFPIVAVSEISINPYTGLLRASTYGRGAWELPAAPAAPALQLHKEASTAVPVGPGGNLTFNITLRNVGSAAATNAVLSDTLPAHTTFVSASNGGSLNGSVVTWNLASIPAASVSADGFGSLAPGDVTLTLVVKVDNDQLVGGTISNTTYSLSADGGIALTGSPAGVVLSPALQVGLTPATQTDGGHANELIPYSLTIHNNGSLADSYALSASGNAWPLTFWDAGFSSQITATPSIASGATFVVGVKVSIPSGAANAASDTATVTATSQTNAGVIANAALKTLAVRVDVLLVDGNLAGAKNEEPLYRAGLDSGGYAYNVWNLNTDPVLPQHLLNSYKAVVWYTSDAYPGPITPYEAVLANYLDSGGRLFLSGMDILDQAAGTTAFVHDYLHVAWDGLETQNDKSMTTALNGVGANPLTADLGPYSMNFLTPGLVDFSDLLTPLSPAAAALQDSAGVRALTVSQGAYKVWFLAFPWEAISGAGSRQQVLARALTDFGVNPLRYTYLPLTMR